MINVKALNEKKVSLCHIMLGQKIENKSKGNERKIKKKRSDLVRLDKVGKQYPSTVPEQH